MVGIAKEGAQPRLASWIAWAAANGVLMVVAIINDMPVAAIFNGLAALGNISVLVLSAIKRAGQRPEGTTDWACLTTAGLCLLTIALFPHLTMLGAVLAMVANLVATWPTMLHAWRRPKEETWQLFAANGGANMLGLVSVTAASGAGLASIAGPLISMIGNLALVTITVGCTWLLKIAEEVEEEALEIKEVLTHPQASATETE
ncbi:MAG TPA: hypothetical protein VD735_03660 [Candidatus Saccharimonadales bacterium]|nr:hypothetical protein [Candidatus Saccharimonadales bacterium]